MAKILIVDDDVANRALMAALLQREGHQTIEATDGVSGLAMVRTERPQLIVSDVLMPSMDGYEFVRRLRSDSELSQTAVIFHTAFYHAREARRLADMCGVAQYLVKPCSSAALLAAVNAALSTEKKAPAPAIDLLFQDDHVRLITNQLSQRVDELVIVNERLLARNAQLSLIQATLEARESDLANAERFAHMGSWSWRAQTGETQVSKELPSVFGRTDIPQFADWRGVLFPAEAWDQVKSAVEELVRTGVGYDLEVPGLKGDGEALLINARAEAICSDGGAVVGLRGTMQDITARKRAQELQRASEERYSAHFKCAPDGIVIIGQDSRCLDANPSMCLMLGYTRAELLTLSSSSYLDDMQLPWIGLPFITSDAGADRRRIWRLRRKDGSIFEADAVATMLPDGNLLAYIRDITERRSAEQTIGKVSSLLRAVLDSPSDISIIACDPNLTITVFNAGAEQMLGFTSEEVIGRATLSSFHDSEEIRVCAEWLGAKHGQIINTALLLTEAALHGQPRAWTYLRKNGERITVSLVVTPMYETTGELLGYVGVAHDVTHQAIYEESLRAARGKAEQASGAKSEFLANMSHEIRTPLNAIIGLGYLLEQTALSEDQTQYLGKIQFAGRALLGVVNNVLDLSKIEAGEMSLEDESFDLPVLVRNVSQMLGSQAAAKGIDLNLQSAADLPRLARGDASRLRQIIVNLVNNGIKFTQAGHVELKTFCTEQSIDRMRLRCEVSDTGVGIEAATLARLFAPFTQADASTTRRFGGTGLGLSIARGFVELMGGEIGVTSTVGVGSTFWIEIPLQIAHSVDESGLARGLRNLQILVADSRGDVPDGIGAMVRALGWSPTIVCTNQQLLGALDNTQPGAWPDVIVLNLQPDDSDLRKVLERLEQQCEHAEMPPVILVAEDAKSYVRYQKTKRAADVVLLRPLKSSALFNAVNTVASKRPESHERVLQSTNFDGQHAQWLWGVHVLVADDSDINVEVARRILEKQGAIVATCSDGAAAVEYVGSHRQQLDVVLMDIQMPILDGNGATRRIRGELDLQTLPIVALTAGALVGERQRSLEAGMNDFVSKPFEPQALIRKVRRLVEHARGESIPMVVVDGVPAVRPADRLYPPSIDAGVVQQMFGGDAALFKSLLLRVLHDFADLAMPISLPPDDPLTRSKLKARTHKLKGSASIVGATGVARCAGAAMIALEKSRPDKIVEKALWRLAAALTTLREDVARWTEAEAQQVAVDDGRLPDPGEIKSSDIDELRALLESQNLAAIDKFGVLSQRLSALMDAARFESLRDAVNCLEFQLGADLLRETRASDYRAA